MGSAWRRLRRSSSREGNFCKQSGRWHPGSFLPRRQSTAQCSRLVRLCRASKPSGPSNQLGRSCPRRNVDTGFPKSSRPVTYSYGHRQDKGWATQRLRGRSSLSGSLCTSSRPGCSGRCHLDRRSTPRYSCWGQSYPVRTASHPATRLDKRFLWHNRGIGSPKS